MKPDIKFLISIPVHGNPQICAFYTTDYGVHQYYMQDPESIVEAEIPFWVEGLTEPGLYVIGCDLVGGSYHVSGGGVEYDVAIVVKEKRAYNQEEDFKLFYTPLGQRTTQEDIIYRFYLDLE